MMSHTPISPSREMRQMELNPAASDGAMHSPANVQQQADAARAQAVFYGNPHQQWVAQQEELEEVNSQKALFLASLNEVGMRLHNAKERIAGDMISFDREYQQLAAAKDNLEQHLSILSDLHPKDWSKEGLSSRLRDSLEILDRADNALNEVYYMGRHLQHTDVFQSPVGSLDKKQSITWRDLLEDLLRGFFFHLPLFLLIFSTWFIFSLFN